eukprot:6212299-Pleurochrysis_carterae.AAC.1
MPARAYARNSAFRSMRSAPTHARGGDVRERLPWRGLVRAAWPACTSGGSRTTRAWTSCSSHLRRRAAAPDCRARRRDLWSTRLRCSSL